MLSRRLIENVERHCDQIMTGVIAQIREDREARHLSRLAESELRDWGSAIVRNLGHWLAAGRDHSLARRYEHLGHLRFEESIPLHEAVRGLHILKRKMIDYIREWGLAQSAAEVYAEEELEYLAGGFFDWLVEHLVRGYEDALRTPARRIA